MDEEGGRAYVAHLQEAFLAPATAKSGAAAVQNGAHADSSSEDDSEDEDEAEEAANPEDAGRRHVPHPQNSLKWHFLRLCLLVRAAR